MESLLAFDCADEVQGHAIRQDTVLDMAREIIVEDLVVRACLMLTRSPGQRLKLLDASTDETQSQVTREC